MKRTNKAKNLLVCISGGLVLGAVLFAATPAKAAVSHELMYAIELSTDNLISFYSDAPGTVLSSRAITGLQAAENIRGIDVGSDGKLYGLGSSSRLYTIDPATGAATVIGTQFSTLLNGSTFGFDVGPTGARVVSDLAQSLLINTSTGAATVQASPVYGAGDPHFGQTPRIDSLAFNPAGGGTWLAGDSLANSVATYTPSTGNLTTIGATGIDFSRFNGFDLSEVSGVTYLASPAASSDPAANLYTINPLTGAATLIGLIGNPGDNILINGLAVAAIPEPSSLGLLGLGGLLLVAFLRRKN